MDNIAALRHFALRRTDRESMAGKKRNKRSVTNQLNLAARSARTALARELARHEVHPGQDAVLLALEKEDGIALGDLAHNLGVRPPTITKTIARLAQQGLVEKRRDRDRTRRNRAYLTSAGLALVSALRDSQESVEKSALRGFSKSERKALRKLLRRLEKNLGTATAENGPDE